ncbi:helix-turn-helix transcriptional regulator [Mesorhizobium sp. SP-1A]|uniref:helix-turn-helix transcriptional regulator n=1 Tax=Mesorhizobium sp. SP-1A TaxID=3077840 RepID=UPI0028F7127D|nr:helix-turn-helix transcriptional regulator [Mesorhizobium sp. SP-1A]
MEVQSAIEPIADMVSLIGREDFSQGFFAAMNRLIGIDHCTVFMADESAMRTLVAQANTEESSGRARMLAESYIKEGYRSDPVWNMYENLPEAKCSLLVSPAAAADDTYRQEFYVKPRIKHELAVTSTVNAKRIYAGFYREEGGEEFSHGSMEFLQHCGSAIIQILHKHGEVSRHRDTGRPRAISQKALLERVQAAINADNNTLTAREAQICASIVLGYTVLGISLNLGISINTVATHRKRAYAKLRVSSQNELFARYFSIVEHNMDVMRHH